MPDHGTGRDARPKIQGSNPVAAYWDENRRKSLDPAFWMAHPLCREAINRRVSGSPHVWPLDWFRGVLQGVPFDRGLSWGCGLGAFERSAIRCGIVREIDAFDISPASLEDARREAEREGISGIRYRVGSFDDPHLEPNRYDVVFFHASLHHVARLERLFRRLSEALKPAGAIYVDEYIGPSRDGWSDDEMRLARAVLEMIPRDARIREHLAYPIERDDPSEAIRSAEIPRFLHEFFEISQWRPYGGQVVDLVMPCVAREWAISAEGHRYVAAMLEIEEAELQRVPSRTHHVVVYGRRKSGPGAGSRTLRLPRLAALRRVIAHRRSAAAAVAEIAPPERKPGGR